MKRFCVAIALLLCVLLCLPETSSANTRVVVGVGGGGFVGGPGFGFGGFRGFGFGGFRGIGFPGVGFPGFGFGGFRNFGYGFGAPFVGGYGAAYGIGGCGTAGLAYAPTVIATPTICAPTVAAPVAAPTVAPDCGQASVASYGPPAVAGVGYGAGGCNGLGIAGGYGVNGLGIAGGYGVNGVGVGGVGYGVTGVVFARRSFFGFGGIHHHGVGVGIARPFGAGVLARRTVVATPHVAAVRSSVRVRR